MTTKKISLCYKVLVLASLMVGITLNVVNTISVTAIMSYYTLQSNMICAMAFLFFIIVEALELPFGNSNKYYVLKGTITMGIFLTALVYRFTLAPTEFQMDSLNNAIADQQLANLFVHTISPILVISDYFLFDQKGGFKWFYPFIWVLMPIGYVGYVYLYRYLGGTFYGIGGSRHFAYFFLDYEKIGYLGVLKWIVVFNIVILCFSYVLLFIDHCCALKLKEA